MNKLNYTLRGESKEIFTHHSDKDCAVADLASSLQMQMKQVVIMDFQLNATACNCTQSICTSATPTVY